MDAKERWVGLNKHLAPPSGGGSFTSLSLGINLLRREDSGSPIPGGDGSSPRILGNPRKPTRFLRVEAQQQNGWGEGVENGV